MKGYSKKISDVYVIPLPYFIKSLPPLIPHNPVSIVMYIWALFKANPVQPLHKGILSDRNASEGNELGVRVHDPESMMQLWEQGFFGKGTLSRSEPSWFGRTARRMGLDGGELTLEEVTEMRRAKRRQFKKDREVQQWQELIDKKRREGATDLPEMPESARLQQTEPQKPAIRQEDLNLVRGITIERLEYLQLSPCEAVFLHLSLGVLDICGLNTAEILQRLLPTPEDWRNYVVYHYYRSLGWCVRGAVKFGADFLIYRKGPPFTHAKFAILVMAPDQAEQWWWLHTNMRVLGGAKKTLTLAYVQNTSDELEMPQWQSIRCADDFRKALMKYKVKTVTCTRFAPSKNRD